MVAFSCLCAVLLLVGGLKLSRCLQHPVSKQFCHVLPQPMSNIQPEQGLKRHIPAGRYFLERLKRIFG